MAAAVKLGQAFQAARIEAFALLRYRGLVPDIEMFIDPCIGKITFDGADTIWREP